MATMALPSLCCSSSLDARCRMGEAAPVQLPGKAGESKVLILGGTGKVGGSTARALSRLCPSLRLFIAGRNREKGSSLVSTIGRNAEFVETDITDMGKLLSTLAGMDLVVHTAGPFQQMKSCNVLEAAIRTKTPYMDVCDDTEYSWRAKSFHEKAVATGIPAMTCCGIYPGVSNVMAAELVRLAKSEGSGEPEKLRFSYYTAGSGGAGPTILATSFLLLGEDVVAYNKGKLVKLKPYSGMLNVDFGKGIRKRDVYLLNLPEVRSTHEILGVPTVSARFGTAPFFWNWGMAAIASLVPADFLRDRSSIEQLVRMFDPLVRAIDGIVGERVSMRVDLECSNGRSTLGIFSHKKLSISVGVSTAAFALAMLEGNSQPGVWFPEEIEGLPVEARERLLSRASQGTLNFVMNRQPWMVETDPKEAGLVVREIMANKNPRKQPVVSASFGLPKIAELLHTLFIIFFLLKKVPIVHFACIASQSTPLCSKNNIMLRVPNYSINVVFIVFSACVLM